MSSKVFDKVFTFGGIVTFELCFGSAETFRCFGSATGRNVSVSAETQKGCFGRTLIVVIRRQQVVCTASKTTFLREDLEKLWANF